MNILSVFSRSLILLQLANASPLPPAVTNGDVAAVDAEVLDMGVPHDVVPDLPPPFAIKLTICRMPSIP
jgi:hypothetical protein